MGNVSGVRAPFRVRRRAALAAAVLALMATACPADDGADVRTVEGSAGSVSGSASGVAPGSGSGSGSGSASGVAPGATGTGLGGYKPGSDVIALANVSQEACDLAGLLPEGRPPDFAAAAALYGRAPSPAPSPGTAPRTLKALATDTAEGPTRDIYAGHFRDPAWLDTYAAGALAGTGAFAGLPDGVRREAVLGAVRNQIPLSAMFHALDTARVKIRGPGNVLPGTGAPRFVDEAWALFRGANASCAPFAVGELTGGAFGTGTTLNDRIRNQMLSAQAASLSGQATRLAAAADEIARLVTIVNVQAVLRAAAEMDQATAAADAAGAQVRRARGNAAFRAIEALVAKADPQAARTVAAAFDVRSQPDAGAGARAVTALGGAYAKLAIDPLEVGTLGG